ncbi:MAG: hypothetical protein ABI988_10935, partial [Nitrospirota bacterium]
ALALAPGMAHVLKLPNKINVSREDYLTVQHIYRGWTLLGFFFFGALVSTLVLTLLVRHDSNAFCARFDRIALYRRHAGGVLDGNVSDQPADRELDRLA